MFQVGVVIGRGRENGLVFERFRLNRLVVFDFAGGDESSPNPIFPFGRPDGEATPVAGLGMADASFEPEPRILFTVGEFIDPEPTEIHSSQAFRVVERAQQNGRIRFHQVDLVVGLAVAVRNTVLIENGKQVDQGGRGE